MKLKINNRGQTLVELIMAVAVIQIGLFSVWSLFLVNFNAEHEAEMRIVGVNLAREGVEVIRNIRDSNWLKSTYNSIHPDGSAWFWDDGLSNGTYAVNFDSVSPDPNLDHQDIYVSANPGMEGFYTNTSDGRKTPYQRKIILTGICCTDTTPNDLKCDDLNYSSAKCGEANSLKIGINVISQVNWTITGQSRQAILEDDLYDWK
jgi:Tfp pilus assembly protein PilV